jgi:hypothetical protein
MSAWEPQENMRKNIKKIKQQGVIKYNILYFITHFTHFIT